MFVGRSVDEGHLLDNDALFACGHRAAPVRSPEPAPSPAAPAPGPAVRIEGDGSFVDVLAELQRALAQRGLAGRCAFVWGPRSGAAGEPLRILHVPSGHALDGRIGCEQRLDEVMPSTALAYMFLQHGELRLADSPVFATSTAFDEHAPARPQESRNVQLSIGADDTSAGVAFAKLAAVVRAFPVAVMPLRTTD